MPEDKFKSISVALVGLFVAFLGFWSTTTTTCGTMNQILQKRVDALEQRAFDLHALKLESDLFIVKLEYELQKKQTDYEVIQAYIDKIPLPVWIKRKPEGGGELVMVAINRAYEERYGISREAYQGQPDTAVWPLDIARQFMRADQEVLRRKTAVNALEEVIENGVRKTATFWKFYLDLPRGEAGVGGILSCLE